MKIGPNLLQGRFIQRLNRFAALVDLGFTLTSTDAGLPTPLLQEAITKEELPKFTGYERVIKKFPFGASRLDLLLEGKPGLCFIEAKCVTLVVNAIGLFPNAPTTHGTKHLYTLGEVVQRGHRAAVVFVVQRGDTRAFFLNDPADVTFGKALREVVKQGVEVYTFRCRVSQEEIQLEIELPVLQ